MDINKIASADILDIVFDGRNKEYGAYQLRKTYNRRIRNALVGTFVICALLLALSIIANKSGDHKTEIVVQDVNLEALKPEEKKPDKSEDDKSQQFQSILKNYLKDETVEDKPQQKTASNQQASFTDGISTLEFQAFQRQLSGCWNLMSGTRYAENMIVDIRLTVGPDRKVQNATVVDQARYNSDPYFRAAADSAVRAVYNPSCSPLDLPPEKYELWKDIVVTFDPRKML